MDKLNISRMTGKTVNLLSHALDYRSANHHVIAGNMANIETPGFRPKELSFDKELERAVEKNEVSLRKTNSKHFSHCTGSLEHDGPHFTIQPAAQGPSDTGQMNLDREMAKMMQNNLLYEASAKLLTKKFEALRTAIDAGRS